MTGPVSLASSAEDTSRVITQTQLLGNSSDSDGPNPLSITGLAATSGTIVYNGDLTWTYTPAANYNGPVTLNYSVTDGVASVPTSASLTITEVSDGDVMVVNGTLNPDSLRPNGTLFAGTAIPGDQFVIATDPVDAPRLEMGLRADPRFQPPAPRDPSDPAVYSLTNLPTFIVPGGKVQGTINDAPGTADDLWARWNYAVSINADTSGADTKKVGDYEFTFTLRNETTNTVLGSGTLEQGLLAFGVPQATIDAINNGSIYQDSINFKWLFPTTFDPDDSATYTIAVDARSRANGSLLLSNKIEVAVNHKPVANADTLSATEDTPVTFTAAQLLGNDTDKNLDPLSIASVTSGTGGTVVLNPNGTVTFTPDQNFNGEYKFTYVATDGKPIESLSAAATVTVNVAAVNDVPTVVAPLANVNVLEDAVDTTINLLPVFSDVEDVTLTYTAVSNNPSLVTATVSGSSLTLDYQPNASGTTTIVVTAKDSNNATVTNTFTVTVAAVNDAPVAVDDTAYTTLEDTTLNVSVAAGLLANDSDVDGPALTVSQINGQATNVGVPVVLAKGTLTVQANGSFVFVPSANATGNQVFSYTVSDGSATDDGDVTIAISPVNDAPVVANPIADQTIAEEGTVNFTFPTNTFSDADGDTLVYTTGTLPVWLSFNAATRTFTGTAPLNFNGFVDITVTATDPSSTSASDTFRLTVTPVNDAPVAVDDTAYTTAEDTTLNVSVAAGLLANDTDVDGPALTVSRINGQATNVGVPVVLSKGTLTVQANGSFVFVPNADANGNQVFSYTVSDGSLSDDGDVTIAITAVNDAPVVANPIADQSIAEEGTVNFTFPAGTFSDADGDSLVYTTGTLPGWLNFNAATRTFTGTAPLNFNGFLDITVTATDPSNASASDTFRLTVTPVNDAPVVTGPVSLTSSAEDTSRVISQTTLLGNSSDVDGPNPLSITGLAATSGTIVYNGDLTWTYTPAANASGPVTLNYNVTDGTASVATSATFTVTAVNDLPTVVAPLANVNVLEDAADTNISLAGVFADVEDDAVPVALTYTAVSNNPALVTVSITGNTLTLDYQPDANGTTTVVVTAKDSNNATVTNTFTVTVAAVNDVPVVTAPVSLLSSAEDTSRVITQTQLLSNSSDIDGPNPLSITGLAASSGTIVYNGDLTWTYTPAPNASGPVTLNYNVTDGAASVATSATFTVTAVNDAPTVVAPLANVNVLEDAADTNVSLAGVFADVEDDAVPVALTYTAVSNNPALVTVSITGNTLTLDYQANANGTTTVVVTAKDSNNATVTNTFTVTVASVNDAPVVTGPVSLASSAEDTSRVITQTQLLGNSSDSDGPNPLSITGLAATSGTIVYNGDLTWTYTPAANYNGPVTLNYSVTDGAASVPTSASLTITEVSDGDVMVVDGALNPDSLRPNGTLFVGNAIPGNKFVIATDPVDAPRLEMGLRADPRFQPPAPRDPSDPAVYSLTNLPTFIVPGGKAQDTINDAPGTADDLWARWNYAVSINADTSGADTKKVGDYEFTFTLRNETTNTVLGSGTLEQGLLAFGVPQATIDAINNGSIYQDSINFKWLFPTTFDPDDSATYTIAVDARSRANGSLLLSNKIEVAVNHKPVANADTLSATEDTPVTFTAAQLLGNDTDKNLDPLSIASVTSGLGGTVVLNPNGTVTFTPNRTSMVSTSSRTWQPTVSRSRASVQPPR